MRHSRESDMYHPEGMPEISRGQVGAAPDQPAQNNTPPRQGRWNGAMRSIPAPLPGRTLNFGIAVLGQRGLAPG